MVFSPRSPDFQRAFLAMRYFWGTRGGDLADAFQELPLASAAAEVLSNLSHIERSERAQALGAELARLASALDERGLWR